MPSKADYLPYLTMVYWACAYSVKISRTGKNGTISVRALDGPKASIVPATFSGVSPPGYTILDVDANALLFVGGLTGKIKVTYCMALLYSITVYSKNSKF